MACVLVLETDVLFAPLLDVYKQLFSPAVWVAYPEIESTHPASVAWGGKEHFQKNSVE